MRLFGVKVVGNLEIDGQTVCVTPLSWLFCAASAHPVATQSIVDTFDNDAGHTIQERKCAICGTTTFIDVSLDTPTYRDEVTLVPN
jgi:hypothetical protein